MPITGDYSKSITVGFDTSSKTFNFSEQSVQMTKPGRVVLIKDNPGDQSWTFVSATVDTDPGQFSLEIATPVVLVIDDQHTANGSYSYTVTVQDADGQHTSPDPIIRNEDPSR